MSVYFFSFFLFFFRFLGVEGMYPLNEILCGWLFLKGFICGQKYCDFDGIMTEICVAHWQRAVQWLVWRFLGDFNTYTNIDTVILEQSSSLIWKILKLFGEKCYSNTPCLAVSVDI